MKDLVLKYEVNRYTDSKGQEREAINYYVEIETNLGLLKVQLATKDYTSTEILRNYFTNKK